MTSASTAQTTKRLFPRGICWFIAGMPPEEDNVYLRALLSKTV